METMQDQHHTDDSKAEQQKCHSNAVLHTTISNMSSSTSSSDYSTTVEEDSSDSGTTTISNTTSTTSTSSSVTLQQRLQHYGPNIAVSFDQPLLVERGEGCWLFDEEGNAYLDCVNNVAHVGHGNPRVAAAVSAQLCRVNTNSRYLSSELNAYCRELADTLPAPLEVVYLVNSGSEANDLALRIATAAAATRSSNSSSNASVAAASPASSQSVVRDHVVVMAGAYHGHLSSLIPLSPYKFWGPGGGGKPDWVHVMPAPDTYRGINLDGAAAARAVLAQAAAAGGRVVAFFCESIISCGGQLMLPPGYLSGVYGVMRAAGVVCIADEVQTGFGRSGSVQNSSNSSSSMWAFDYHQEGVVPDIVTLGKPMGNGFPISGVVTSPALAAAFADGGMEYFNTYGGNNAAVAAGRAVLREIKEQGLLQHAADVGRYILTALKQLQQQHPSLIADVRGQGLFIGFELVTCPKAKTPAPLAAKTLKEGAKARRVLLTTDGPVGHVIKIKPPMVFGFKEVDHMVAVISEVLSEMTAPAAWQQLVAAEQQHRITHVEPILSRYRANELQVWAAAAELEQQQQQGTADQQSRGGAATAAAAAAAVGSPSGAACTVSQPLQADCNAVLLAPGVAATASVKQQYV